jgi:hypothetical protein
VQVTRPISDPGRCLTCGRRFRGEHAGCAPRELAIDEVDAGAVGELPQIPGYRNERVLGDGDWPIGQTYMQNAAPVNRLSTTNAATI